MQILKFDCIESTQLYLVESLRNGSLSAPIMVVADVQSGGVGSRGNAWESVEDGLYFSVAIPFFKLPQDLPLESVSIYMGYIFKEILNQNGAQVWLKWPNDLYVGSKKAGGIICTKLQENIIVGIGINLKVSDMCFGVVEVGIQKEAILEILAEILECEEKKFSWKQIFSKYALEFHKNFNYGFHYKGSVLAMSDAVLCDDGAILIENEKIYSLR
ncbi:biotin--[acetyl-CoA-carboxylase] ligase [Helicobacter turcicus]|uniref:Biotin--[acetyl-CoA-carboxylase] ligase n=1 Tax=Helicobacter turcicus TaxID=2867412 RepID=A0ABS7JL02_9HELI|nr:biotin--[acetyl-CoA-carboxylase] ligase [Helicobacter turcicus]MBX7490079.1 biotin--[acetyl-CoA-carboxylase] ligase [Helicobacter turcicus]MBX7544938.1 biotin--[acetyl-CoA-carboxylase] ligase [Helicobacter turcicus]